MFLAARHVAARMLTKLAVGIILLAGLLLWGVESRAMTEMSDDQMSSESGAGIAIALEGFSFRMAPTSYIELTGQNPNSTEAGQGWFRGDARYFGLSITGTSQSATSGDAAANWYGSACNTAWNASLGNLACPMGTGANLTINDFASVYNPYVLRVFQYPGLDSGGNCLGGSGCTGTSPTVLEFAGPTNSDTWRFAFWGALEVGRNQANSGSSTDPNNPVNPYTSASNGPTEPQNYALSTAAGSSTMGAGCLASGNGNTSFCGLQSQSIIIGKPIATTTISGSTVNLPTDIRILSLQDAADPQGALNASDPTMAIIYQSALSGNFRFSVGQTSTVQSGGPAGGGTGSINQVPDFDQQEGLYFMNVNAFLPLGRMYYQTITFKDLANNGNFTVDLNAIPNVANDYNDFYCGGQYASSASNGCSNIGANSCATVGAGGVTGGIQCQQIGPTSTGGVTYLEPVVNSPNPYTHGFVYWGCTSGASCTDPSPTGTAVDNGIIFHAPTGQNSPAGSATGVTNIGTATISGMLIQQLTITTKGAN